MVETVTLLISCPDRRGLVAGIAQVLYQLGTNILDADQHLDRQAQLFFQRIRFTTDGSLPRAELDARIAARCQELGMTHRLVDSDRRKRMAVLVSKQPHCLIDLILRQREGELASDVACVISNHRDAEEVARTYGLPFHHLPITPATKPRQEAALLDILGGEAIDFVVLARYMQVLSPHFLRALARPVVNIHHSFLPAFSGERPYHRAYERGVKLIGATAHYVTAELDAGPIIEQDVVRTTHADEVDDLVRKGRDLEKLVLARAVRLHVEDRVLVYHNKTVVFG